MNGGFQERNLVSMEFLFDRPTANPSRDVCTLEHVINKCAQRVTPSQFTTIGDDTDTWKVTDDNIIREMQQCVTAAIETPCGDGVDCKPCGELLGRIGDGTFVVQDIGVDQMVECYNKNKEERDACFDAIPYKALFIGRDQWGKDFYTPTEAGYKLGSTDDKQK